MPLDKDKFDDVSAYARHLRGLDEEEKRKLARQAQEDPESFGGSLAGAALDSAFSGASGVFDVVTGAVEVVADVAGAAVGAVASIVDI
jgi:hypothetical protein